jgi:hypothetical protein
MRSHLWFKFAVSEGDHRAAVFHTESSAALPTRSSDRGLCSLRLGPGGVRLRIKPTHVPAWPFGTSDSQLLVRQTADKTLAEFAFIAPTPQRMWLALDIFMDRPGFGGVKVQRVALENIYAGLERAKRDGGDSITSGWFTCEHPNAIHAEGRHVGDPHPHTVVVFLVGVAHDPDEALSMANYTGHNICSTSEASDELVWGADGVELESIEAVVENKAWEFHDGE